MRKQQQSQPSTKHNQSLGIKMTESMRKKFFIRQFYFTIYHIFRIGISISIIILICETNLEQITKNYYYKRVQQILELWNKNVIVDLITVSSNNCPETYQPYTSAAWIGTKQGCLCTTQLHSYDFISVLPGQCTSKLINAGCTRVNSQKSIPFTFWKPNQLICVKRIKGLNFYTNLSDILNNNIIKKCGDGKSYEFESITASNCPITSISNKSSTFTNKLPLINFSYTFQNNYPIIDIKITQYRFCEQYNKQNISPNRSSNYNLQYIQIENCLLDNDPRVQIVDSENQKQLFTNNPSNFFAIFVGIYQVVVNQLPIYPIPSSRFYYLLGATRYPPWTYQCRKSHEFSLSNTNKMFQFTENIEKSKICMYLTILLIAVWGFLYSIAYVFQKVVDMRNRYRFGVLFYPDEILTQINPNLILNTIKLTGSSQVIAFIFINLVGLGMLIQLGVQYHRIGNTDQWFRQSFKCMDGGNYFREWIQQGYLDIIQTFTRKYIICILQIIVAMVIDVIFLIWRFHKGDLTNYKIKNLFMEKSGRISDGRISESQSDCKEEEEEDNQGKMQQVNDEEMQTIQVEVIQKKKQHRNRESDKKQNKKQQSEQNLDIFSQKTDERYKKITIFNKKKIKKDKKLNVQQSKQKINYFTNLQ